MRVLSLFDGIACGYEALLRAGIKVDAYYAYGSEKAYTLRASNPNWVIESIQPPRIRKLTPIECERLQTLPDNYTEWVSDTQRYKMLGNWWTVDVVSHIFKHLK